MNCSKVKIKFPDYLTGDLDSEAVEILQDHVAGSASCRRELEELTSTWTQLGVLPEEQPGPNVRKNFYTMLESYKEELEKEKSFIFNFRNIWEKLRPARPVYQLAFTIVFLVMGFTVGYFFSFSSGTLDSQYTAEVTHLRGQVQQMRQNLALAMLDQSSPSQRLKGLSWSSTVETPDEKLLEALLETLNHDPNVNVRLSAVDALYLFSHHPMVKKGIVESLPRQTSPLVQVALIDLMVDMREKQAADALKRLIQDNKLNPEVKQRAKLCIQQLI